MATLATAPARGGLGKKDQSRVFWFLGGMLSLIVLFAVFGPKQRVIDPQPTNKNAGTAGIKAAFLILPKLGYKVEEWNESTAGLERLDAERTTLLLIEPILPFKGLQAEQKNVAAFLERGGRVVATGAAGAKLLPEGKTDAPTRMFKGLCFTNPEGAGALAKAGEVGIAEPVRWSASGPQFRVEQRCGPDAVVVRYGVGKGEAVWWSSPMPMTNAGLGEDTSLALTLASVGAASVGAASVGAASVGAAGRTVVFDEYVHGSHETVGETLSGLPWWALTWQLVGAALLLVLSRGRRKGPLRSPVRLPRNSPVEFAESMGRLYERAGASEAATGAARKRLMDFLHEACGLSHEVLRGDAASIADALRGRFGGDWNGLRVHLEQVSAEKSMRPKAALKLVRMLEEDRLALEGMIQQGRRNSDVQVRVQRAGKERIGRS